MAADDGNSRHKLKLNGKLGSGAFGTVYRGLYNGVDVAVKVLSGEKTQGSWQERQFMSEAKCLQACQHRNVLSAKALVKINAASVAGHRNKGESTERWALVLELMTGGSLHKKVCTQMVSPGRRVYSDVQALQWALDVARGLEYLHLRTPCVVHRDVKPSNLLLTTEGGRVVAKLSDLGLHVVLDDQRSRLMRSSFTAHSCESISRMRAAVRNEVAAVDEDDSSASTTNQPGSIPSNSMRRPSHHPSGPLRRSSFNAASFSTAGGVAPFNSSSFVAAHPALALRRDGSLSSDTCHGGSLATEGTVDCLGGPDEDGSGDGEEWEMETVFELTGETGSYTYMAPEVFKREPYNEKVDVFSFGVVLLELLSRHLLIFSLPDLADANAGDKYAARVAAGYRPPRPTKLDPRVWQLVERCWQQDPVVRPDMSQVVDELEGLLLAYQAHQAGARVPARVAAADDTPEARGLGEPQRQGAASRQAAPSCSCVIS